MFWVNQVRWCVFGAMRSVPDGAQQWKCWIPCYFYNEVVADYAVVVNSWLLYCGGWSPTMSWGRQLELTISMCGLSFQVVYL